MKHANIAIFVPHVGCPNLCSFCNQKAISGTHELPDGNFVRRTCEQALSRLSERTADAEIAFFGGSFTAIDRRYMLELLQAAHEYVGEKMFSGIRISTRPDAITPEILDILKQHGVTAIELGVQSLDDTVLSLNDRGHTAIDAQCAIELIQSYRFSLGLQMMVGLYGDNKESLYETVNKIIGYHPDTVRIYPTVVIKGTRLEQLLESGQYVPIDLDEAVAICADLLCLFEQHNIMVIRLGLHSEADMQNNMVGGIYHPAFRELCENHIFLNRAIEQLADVPTGQIVIHVHPTAVSKMVGQKKRNIFALCERGYQVKVVADSTMKPNELTIKDVKNCC